LPTFSRTLPWYSIIDKLAAQDPSLNLLRDRCESAADFVRSLG
jgi:hypothetical protein